MLPKRNRLHTSKEILTVRRMGRRMQNNFCTLFVVVNPTIDIPKFTFIVSTKISKRAVQRNRTKRLLRQAVHNRLTDIKPAHVVCVAKSNLSDVPLQEVQFGVEQLLRQAGLLAT